MVTFDVRMLAAALLAVLIVPGAFGQGVGQGACERDPASCDAAAANEGELRRHAEPVRTILFAHFPDLLQQAPLTLQGPLDSQPDLNDGFLLPSVITGTDTAADVKFRNNRFTMFSSPGQVETRPDGWAVWQDARLGYETYLNGPVVTGYWYMSADAVPSGWAEEVESPPGAMAMVGVYMRMETGRVLGLGDLLAEGDTGTGYGGADAENLAGTVTMFNVPGEDTVYEFRVPMAIRNPTLPGGPESEGFIVTVVPYQVSSGDGTELTSAEWRVRTGAAHPPRLVMDIIRPMKTESSQIHVKDGLLFIDWSFVSLLGSYDFNLASLAMEINGPKSAAGSDVSLTRIEHRFNPGQPVAPIRVVWVYDYRASPLPDGVYSIQGSVKNLDRTYQLDWSAGFVVEDERPKVEALEAVFEGGSATPGIGTPVALIAVGALALGRRGLRRRF